jgi:hypothetical protein
MAGPSIAVRFLGDFSKLKAGMSDVGAAAKANGGSIKDAFAPALAVLNKSGVLGPFKEALDGVGESINAVKEHIRDLPLAMAAAGAGIAGVGTALTAMGDKDKAAHAQLQAAVDATGKSYEGYEGQVESAIKKQEKFGTTANTTQDALRILTQATNDPAKAMQYLGTASDLAAAKHETLTVAAQSMAQAYAGNTRALKEFGIQAVASKNPQQALTLATNQAGNADKTLAAAKQKLSDIQLSLSGKTKLTLQDQIKLRDAQQKVTDATSKDVLAQKKMREAQDTLKTGNKQMAAALDELGTKLKGQASASADTFSGRLRELKARGEDAISVFGQKYGPDLQKAGAAMAGLGGAMKAGQAAMEAAKAAALGTRIELGLMSAATKVQTAVQWLLNAAMDANPIVLIVIAIVALVAIIVLVLVKTGLLKDAWNDMKKAAEAVWNAILVAVHVVWDWIKTNWPLLLGILLGPIALAAALIYKYWDSILKGIQAVWNWIRAVWGDVVNFLVGPISAAIHWIAGAWGAVTGTIAYVVDWVRAVWGSLYGALTGTIGAAVGWIRGAWGSIIGAVQGVVSTIEGIFNGMINFIAGLPGRIASVASHAFDSIIGAGRGAINAVIDVWNHMAAMTSISVGFTVPVVNKKISFTTPQLVPDLPHLAQGGLIVNEGLVYAHAGEVISPVPSGVGGPAVVVQNAHFNTELDIELFMRRAAWVVQTARI